MGKTVKQILLVPHNHFDPTWRRCFDRSAEFHGTVVRSYAEVEELCINAFLSLAERGYSFSEGQAVVWRKYLQRNPDKLEKVRELIRNGQLSLMMAGETVQDTNLPSAEGLIRNFLVAMPVYRELSGDKDEGLQIGWLEDAFGNSPNYPQVLKGVGATAAARLSYRSCPGEAYVGIDGTALPCEDHVKSIGTGAFDKHPPCPACHGRGCTQCNGVGMTLLPWEYDRVKKELIDALKSPDDFVLVGVVTEELLPDVKFADMVDELNREHARKAVIRFGTPLDVHRRVIADLQAKAAKVPSDEPGMDLNPAMPGCMVSRIRCKQRTRGVAYELLVAESVLANRSWQAQRPEPQPEELNQAWRLVAFNQFHDAVTGTHVDQANIELMDMLDEAERTARRFLPHKVAAAGEKESFAPVTNEPTTKRMGTLEVTFDRTGISAIAGGGKDVFGRLPYTASRPDFRIADLVLESDFGDAWGQRIAPHGWPTSVMMVPLGSFNTAVEASERAIRWRGRYAGGDPKVHRLEWTITARASKDGHRIDFTTEVDWDTGSKRLRVIVPVDSQELSATYEVPFGFVDRTYDESKLDYSQWKSNTMEFPALHWVRKAIDEKRGVAVLNKGLPCQRWMPGRFDFSLVRSPEYGFCAVEPGHYEFWDIDGQRDTGRHVFEYSVWPYFNGLTAAELTRAGYAYNLPGDFEIPFEIEGEVVPTAWKMAQDGSGWILRLQEISGTGTDVMLRFNRPHQVTRTDMLERPQEQGARSDVFTTRLHRHGILTLLIQ